MLVQLMEKFYRAIVRRMIFYGLKCYGLSEANVNKDQLTEMRMRQPLLAVGLALLDQEQNAYIRNSLELADIERTE